LYSPFSSPKLTEDPLEQTPLVQILTGSQAPPQVALLQMICPSVGVL